MKTDKYQKRFYRDWVGAKDLYLSRIVVKETDLQILTDKKINTDFAIERVKLYRRQIEAYISKDRRFLTSLKPLAVELNATPIVKKMAQASRLANVGPMAAVAGAVAESLGKDLLKQGCKEVIIENGGDIFMATRKARRVAIFATGSKLWQRLFLKIKSKDTPLGICTSSGKIGHSLSFGRCDSVTILSKTTALADSVATAASNLIRSKADLQKAADFARSIRGVLGVVFIIGRNLISWGKIEFVK